MKNTTTASNLGTVMLVRGSVVDIRFEEHLPPSYSVLRAGDEGRIVIEVLAQLNARRVRGIAVNPTQGLARGTAVVSGLSNSRLRLSAATQAQGSVRQNPAELPARSRGGGSLGLSPWWRPSPASCPGR